MRFPTFYAFAFCMEIPLLIFQASVVVFLGIRMAKKDKRFATSFYAIFTLQTIDDCLYYIAVGG